MKTRIRPVLITFALVCFGLLPRAQAVVPPPDGGYPGFNTAEGQNALFNLTTGVGNTAVGWFSLWSDTDGSYNTAVGAGTLLFNVGNQNTSAGVQNTAMGTAALLNNTTGSFNTATGVGALSNNTIGNSNTASGFRALYGNITGGSNMAIGSLAGTDITGNGNVCIGQDVSGAAGVNDTTWIRNVYASVATARAVYVNADDKIGTLSSSRRYKDEIRPMAQASEAILSLKPVNFRYKKEVDPARALSFGLIAEEVDKVDPALVTRDRDGKPQTVRYEAINAMLLNEFLKARRQIDAQQKQIDALTAGLQKVSVQLEASKPAPQTALK